MNKTHFFDSVEESERYLNFCRFIKNEPGSLTTKIQVPNKEEIKESTLFEEPITGSQINNMLIDITRFINEEILDKQNFEPNDDFLLKNKKKINVNFIKSLKSFYESIELKDIDFTLKGNNIFKSTGIRNLTKEKNNSLNSFSNIVLEKIKKISDNIVHGKIIQLKSKDVESNKNSIIVESMVKNVKSKILVDLDSDDYKIAADAHKNNNKIEISGKFEREKTQYKVKELDYFKVIDSDL